jgi:putative hydrolase of the HAD superfamily
MILLHFSLDNFELAQIFENQFLDEIIAYNELVDGSLELLEYLNLKIINSHYFKRFPRSYSSKN